MHNNKVIITGGAGFIGSHITDKLLDKGYSVIVVDNLSSGSIDNLPKSQHLKLYQLNIEKDNIDIVFQNEKPNYVIHLAAQTSVNYSISNPYYDADMNIMATIRLLEVCKRYGIKKFLTASSAAVYGNPQYLPIDENHPTEPMSYYGLSKFTMEKYIQLSGVPYIICRFSNVYGERQSAFGEAGVVSIFNDAMIHNKNIFIDGEGEQSRDFIYVKDVANIVYQLCSSEIKNDLFNISTNISCTINELFKTMAKVYEYPKEPIYRAPRTGDIKDSKLSNSKINYIFKDKFIYTKIEEGLLKILNATKIPMIK